MGRNALRFITLKGRAIRRRGPPYAVLREHLAGFKVPKRGLYRSCQTEPQPASAEIRAARLVPRPLAQVVNCSHTPFYNKKLSRSARLRSIIMQIFQRADGAEQPSLALRALQDSPGPLCDYRWKTRGLLQALICRRQSALIPSGAFSWHVPYDVALAYVWCAVSAFHATALLGCAHGSRLDHPGRSRLVLLVSGRLRGPAGASQALFACNFGVCLSFDTSDHPVGSMMVRIVPNSWKGGRSSSCGHRRPDGGNLNGGTPEPDTAYFTGDWVA